VTTAYVLKWGMVPQEAGCVVSSEVVLWRMPGPRSLIVHVIVSGGIRAFHMSRRAPSESPGADNCASEP